MKSMSLPMSYMTFYYETGTKPQESFLNNTVVQYLYKREPYHAHLSRMHNNASAVFIKQRVTYTTSRIKRLFSHVSKLQSNCRRKQSALSIAGWFIVGGGRVAILSLSSSLPIVLNIYYIYTFFVTVIVLHTYIYIYVCVI